MATGGPVATLRTSGGAGPGEDSGGSIAWPDPASGVVHGAAGLCSASTADTATAHPHPHPAPMR